MATSDPPHECLQAPVPCDGCDDDAPGEHYCTVCHKTMCIGCSTIHGKLMKDHRVVHRAEIFSSRQFTCKYHQNENITFHCNKCHCPICVECVADQHYGHPVTKLSVVVKKERAALEKEVSDLEQKELRKITEALDELTKDEESYNKDIENVKQNMKDEIITTKARLDAFQAERVLKLEEVEKHDRSEFSRRRKKLTDKERTVTIAIANYKAKIRNSDENPVTFLDFVRSKTSVSSELPTKLQIQSPTFQQPSNIHFNFADSLGKLSMQMSTKSVASTNLAGQISNKLLLKLVAPQIISSFKAKEEPSICTTDDGHAWIGGYESRKVVLVNTSGKILMKRKIRHRVLDLAILASGDIIVCPNANDSIAIFRLRTDGTEMFTCIYNAAQSGCNGVSVTSDQQILISARKGKLMRCNDDGTKVKEIYNTEKSVSTVHAIELSDKTICISDWSINGLVVIGKDGQPITTITRPLGRTNYEPWGLACDKMGNILSTDKNNDCVYLIDKNRHVKELVGSSHGIKAPRVIAVDKDHILWIGQDNGTIKLVKYLA